MSFDACELHVLCSCVCTVAVSHRSTTAATPICTGSFGTPFRLLAALVVYFQFVVAHNQCSPTVRYLSTPHQLRTTIGTDFKHHQQPDNDQERNDIL